MIVFAVSAEEAREPADSGFVTRQDHMGRSMISQNSVADLSLRCSCGTLYLCVPKEIPLPNDERVSCIRCGRELKGRRSSRYVDYEQDDDAAWRCTVD